MKQTTVVIHNPHARGGKSADLSAPWEGYEKDVLVVETESSEDAAEQTRKAIKRGVRQIISAGGDGTLHAVLNGMGTNSEATLGILPMGTMNVFAREIGLPTELKECWDIILAGREREVDVGVANGRFFLTNAGVGLDAQVVAETDREFRKQVGPLSYVLKGLEIAGRPANDLKVSLDGAKEIVATFVMMGNGKYYGGPFEVFPGGSLDDGFLDVLFFQRMSHWDVLRYLHGLFWGNAEELPDVHRLRVRCLRVTSDKPVPFEVDGELAGSTPVDFELQKQALRVFCP